MKKIVALVLCLLLCVASIGVAENDALVVATVVKAIGSNWFDSMDWEGTRWAEENGAEMHYIGPTRDGFRRAAAEPGRRHRAPA